LHSLILTNHATVQLFRQAQQLFTIRLHQFAHGDTCPAANDAGDLLLGDLVSHHTALLLRLFTGLRRCQLLLQREEALREVAEIVGIEGLQDADRLVMRVAQRIREEFLSQNAYTDDAFCAPDRTVARIAEIVDCYDRAGTKLAQGVFLDEALKAQS